MGESSRPKKASDYDMGEMVYEYGGFSAGFLVSVYDDPVRTDRLYMLLCNDEKEYTIYVAVKNAICAPSVARFVPEEVIKHFYSQVFNGEIIRRVAVV
jgi:hypothetical protein